MRGGTILRRALRQKENGDSIWSMAGYNVNQMDIPKELESAIMGTVGDEPARQIRRRKNTSKMQVAVSLPSAYGVLRRCLGEVRVLPASILCERACERQDQ